ncbi:alpha/beta hydrolase [Sphingomonas sp. PAMC 26617]|uniref:alpha/beta hydrolase n=1 Tax=Sphingomonas sp. PAMC 26617 TaxID=1112216 RepID=UPI0002893E7B|nr:alpha/beta hydrolase [Sphingomonas sp. PAMC 26617]
MLKQAVHPIDPRDVDSCVAYRAATAPRKGVLLGPEARVMFNAARAATPMAQGVRIEPDVIGGVRGLWCRVSSHSTAACALFLHGGGYVLGSAAATANFASHLAMRSGADTFVADYRLAPEHAFPAAFDDVLAAYTGLAEMSAGPLAVTGESAGGGLALALISMLADMLAVRPPIAAAVMSPWTDLTLSGASYDTRAEADPIFTREALAALANKYLQGQDATDRRASPLSGSLSGLPPIRIDVGEDEVLLDDARRYATKAGNAGAAVTLNVWQGMPHVFQARVGALIAAEQSFEATGVFLAEQLAR